MSFNNNIDHQNIEQQQITQHSSENTTVVRETSLYNEFHPTLQAYRNVMATFKCEYKGDEFQKEKKKPEKKEDTKGKPIPSNAYNRAVKEYKMMLELMNA